MKHTHLLLMLGMAVAIGGCASSNSGDVYSRDEARRVQTVQMGVVEGLRPIRIEGTKSQIGTGAGSIIGAIAGGGAAQGRGSSIGSVLGAVAGGMAGAAAEEGYTRENGVEVTVRLETGRIISVVQTGKADFKIGDRIRILQVDGTTRVAPLN